MGERKRIWIGITAALFAAGCDSEQEPQRTDGAAPVEEPAASSIAEGEGEGEGEGERREEGKKVKVKAVPGRPTSRKTTLHSSNAWA